jgi:hypothetical protein
MKWHGLYYFDDYLAVHNLKRQSGGPANPQAPPFLYI